MKKIISIILLTAMLSSVCVMFSGCADKFISAEMKQSYAKQFNIDDVHSSDILIEYHAGTYNGYTVAMLDASCHDFDAWQEVIGNSAINYPDSNRLLAYKDGKFSTLTEAHASGALSDAEIAEIADKFNSEIMIIYQICDKYDFRYYEEMDVFSCLRKWRRCRGGFAVFVNYELSQKDVPELTVDFLGEDIFKSVTKKNGYYSVELKNNTIWCFFRAVNRLKQIPGVYNINDTVTTVNAEPNDPKYTDDTQWALSDIGLDKVWAFTTGNPMVKVGVIDTGIAVHPDLNANVTSGEDFHNGSNSTKYITTDDIYGHGTYVAGIIGAQGNNSIGISGVCWNVTLVPMQVHDSGNDCDIIAIHNAIDEAQKYNNTDNHYDILNLSITYQDNYGVNMDDDFIPLLLRSIVSMYSGLLVCSAGNNSWNTDLNHVYPGYYASTNLSDRLNNVIVVGALDENDNLLSDSNYGEYSVHIYAPGSNIYSTCSGTLDIEEGISDGYACMSGTSAAAPLVSGVAALLLSANPTLTTAQLKECILNGADQIAITVPDGSTQNARKLNALGAFAYMLKTYMTPSYNINLCEYDISVPVNLTSSNYINGNTLVKIMIPSNKEYRFTVSETGAPIDVDLYDEDLKELYISQTKTNGSKTSSFEKNLSSGIYYLYIKHTGTAINGTVNISIDSDHLYNKWTYYSSTQHIECCDCGARGTVLGTHVVKLSETIIEDKRPCLKCGAIVSNYGPGFGQIIMNVQKVTVNGSYILPNGIIVLVDEDVDAYFAGTLVFYNRDDLPETE